jgi:hypothetical protein
VIYLSIGQEMPLSENEKKTLVSLGECLSIGGWSLRTGGRNQTDDCLLEGAKRNSAASIEVYTPTPHYRHHKTQSGFVYSLESFPFQTQERAITLLEAPSELLSFRSIHEKRVLTTNSALVFGKDLNHPVRFALTWLRNEDPKCLLKSENSVIFSTLKSRGIPIFNLGNQDHKRRVDSFIENNLKRVSSF